MTSGLKAPAIRKAPSLPNVEEAGRKMYAAAHASLWTAAQFKRVSDNAKEIVGGRLLDSAKTVIDAVDKGSDINEAFEKFAKTGAYLNDLERRTVARLGIVTEVVKQYNLDIARADKDLVEAWYAKEYLKSDAAASMMTFIKQEARTLKAEAEPFKAQLRNLQNCLSEIKGPVDKEFKKGIAKVVEVVEQSSIGKRIMAGQKALSPILDKAGKAVDALSVASAAYKTFSEDPTQTVGRRLIKGATAGLAVGVTEFGLKKNPVIAVADIAFEKIGGEQNTIGHFYQSVGKVFNAYADAIIDDNAAPLSKFHQASMNGEHGAILKGYALIGESLAQTGWLDGLAEAYGDWKYKAPKDAQNSSMWHKALNAVLP